MSFIRRGFNWHGTRRAFFASAGEDTKNLTFLGMAAPLLGFLGEHKQEKQGLLDLLPDKETCIRAARFIDYMKQAFPPEARGKEYQESLGKLEPDVRQVLEIVLGSGSFLYRDKDFLASFTRWKDGELSYYFGDIVCDKQLFGCDANLLLLSNFYVDWPVFKSSFYEVQRTVRKRTNLLVILIPSSEYVIQRYYDFFCMRSLAAFSHRGYKESAPKEALKEFFEILKKEKLTIGDIERLKTIFPFLLQETPDKRLIVKFILDIISFRYLFRDAAKFNLSSVEAFSADFKCKVTENNSLNSAANRLQWSRISTSFDSHALLATAICSSVPFFALSDSEDAADKVKTMLLVHFGMALGQDLRNVLVRLMNLTETGLVEACKKITEQETRTRFDMALEEVFDLELLGEVRAEIQKLNAEGVFSK